MNAASTAIHALQTQLDAANHAKDAAELAAAEWQIEAHYTVVEVERLSHLLGALMAAAETTRAGGSTWITIDRQFANDDPALGQLLDHCDDVDGES